MGKVILIGIIFSYGATAGTGQALSFWGKLFIEFNF